MVGTSDAHDATSERVILKHPVFGDGFGILDEPKYGASSFHRLYHLSEQVNKTSFMAVYIVRTQQGKVHCILDILLFLKMLRTAVLAIRNTPLTNIPKGFNSEMSLEVA